MNRRVIPCRVTDEYVQGAGVVVGAAGSHNDVALRLEFSPLWKDTTRSIVWKDALGENPTVTILTTDLLEEGETEVYLVPIPAEPKAAAGELSMTIKGVTAEGEREKTATLSATAHFIILESDWDEDAVESGDLSPTQSEQLQVEIDGIKDTIYQAKQSAAAAKDSEARAGELADAAEASAEAADAARKGAEEAEAGAEEARADTEAVARWISEAVQTAEEWTFELDDGTSVTKQVVLKNAELE